MVTVEERLAALEAQLAQLTATTPTSYYTHQYSGEEIDAAVGQAQNALRTDTAQSLTPTQQAQGQKNLGVTWPCNPNLLDNWYFGRPVNQRGKTEYTGSVYGIDRWRSADATVLLKDGCIRITRDSGNFWYARLMEYLDTDFSSNIAGKTCTISALVKSVSGGGQVQLSIFNITDNSSTTNIYQDLTGKVDLITTSFQVPDSYAGKLLGLFFYPDTMDSNRSNGCDVYAVKLELGPTQTLAHQDAEGTWVLNEIPDYGEQLRRCQRYAVELNPLNHEYPPIGIGQARSTTTISAIIPVPQMRTIPTLTTDVNKWTVANKENYITPSGIGVNAISNNAIQLMIFGAGFVLGGVYEVYLWGHGNAFLSADL